MKRIAVVDLGTNTFNLLVVDKTSEAFTPVFTVKEGVGLGLKGINKNQIAPDAMVRALDTLKAFKVHCERLNVEEIHAFGTSAIRNATNQADFLKKVEETTQLKIQVISGDREAELIYQGVSYGHNFASKGIIMDIGGGSTEFILADQTGILTAQSFEIGVARIFQQFSFADPMTAGDCQKVEDYLQKGTYPFFDGLAVNHLIGASGSFETFYELISNEPYPVNEFITINSTAIEKSLAEIIASTQAQRDQNPRIIPIRKKMAPIAAVKIRWIIRKLNIQKVTISPYALKEGVIKTIGNK